MKISLNSARLAFALCLITTAVNLQAPLYSAYAEIGDYGVGATTIAFSFYVVGILPVLIFLGSISDRIGRKRTILASLALSASATAVMLLFPNLQALGLARWLLGTSTALMSATAPAYMSELANERERGSSASWVTASTSLGFGLGAALTSLFLLFQTTLQPASYWLHLAFMVPAFYFVSRLPDHKSQNASATFVRLPCYPAGTLPLGGAILLSWATVGLVIAVIPSVLAKHGLAHFSGFSTFCVISCGLLFQPMAQQMDRTRSVRLGLIVLPLSYAVLAWGALHGSLSAVIIGAFAASSACYGFVYLGGLKGVAALAGDRKTGANAGFFLMAYFGFSLPVIFTGFLMDIFGQAAALGIFGSIIAIASMGVFWLLSPKTVGPQVSEHPAGD